MTHRVAALVLAAGRSSRMGGPNKLLARFDGVPLVRRTVETALASNADKVVVVTGHQAQAVRTALGGLSVEIAENSRFAEGLSTSLALGFKSLAQGNEGIIIILSDQPGLTVADLNRLIAAFDPATAPIVAAACEGRRGNPVILSTAFAAEIAGLSGDVGARDILAAHDVREIEIGHAALFDVDTPEAMAQAGGVLDP